VEGIEEMKATVFGDAMAGLEDWSFPNRVYVIDGDKRVIKCPRCSPVVARTGALHASRYSRSSTTATASSATRKNLLNMVHVLKT